MAVTKKADALKVLQRIADHNGLPNIQAVRTEHMHKAPRRLLTGMKERSPREQLVTLLAAKY